MPYSYQVTVERLSDSPTGDDARDLAFEVTNHDEIIQLVERVRSRAVLPDDEVAAFTIGLKLLGEVVLRHRHERLFEELFSPLSAFVKRLKALDPLPPTP